MDSPSATQPQAKDTKKAAMRRTRKATTATAASSSTAGGSSRKRRSLVSTAPRLQPRTLLASTRDELLAIQSDLVELADERRRLLKSKRQPPPPSTIPLLPPKQ